jgi:hypothetical protein
LLLTLLFKGFLTGVPVLRNHNDACALITSIERQVQTSRPLFAKHMQQT